MDLLVLGGTRFVGRHIVEAALARGHAVDVFSRGRSPVPEGARGLLGDRNDDLSALERGRWDAAIDVSGYVPGQVRRTAELLSGRAERYLFISSASVYRDFDRPETPEEAPLAQLDDPTTQTVTPETYGGLKVLCERAAADAFRGGALAIRPTFVVGPHDYTDRFTSWLRRARSGGRMLAPLDPRLPLSLIDARDLGRFVVHLAGSAATGAVNAAGPARATNWGEVLDAARTVTGSDAGFAWPPADFLERHGLALEALPMVVPFTFRGAHPHDLTRALALGLTHRPLETTIDDTLAWFDAEGTARAGVPTDLERKALAAWDAPDRR